MPANRSLLALIAAEAISSMGSLMTVVALPWFVLETTGSPSRMGLVLAAETAPMAVLGIASGRLAGRLGARRTLLACDALWAPVIAAIPVLHYAGALSFGVLLLLACLSGVPWAAHYGSQRAVIPELLGEGTRTLAQANAVFQTVGRATYFAGPALAGVLIAWLGAPAVLIVDAATFVVSFVLVAALVPARPVDGPAPRRGGAARLLWRDAFLRRATTASTLSQAAFMAMAAAVPVLAFDHYDRSATLAGVLLGVWGGGAMVGGLVAYRLVATRDPFRLGSAAWVLQALPLWIMAAAPPPGVAVVALGLSGLGNGIRVPPVAALTVARVPAQMRTETMTVSTAVVLSGGFVALLVAGPALDRLGVQAVFGGIAALQTAAAVAFARVAPGSLASSPCPSSPRPSAPAR